MSGDDGRAARDRTRTAVALLAVAGLVLIATVLPVVGGTAPGRSLLPDAATGGGGSAASGGPLDSALSERAGGGQSGGDSNPLVGGMLASLATGAGGSAGAGPSGQSGGQASPSSGSGSSAFGALSPGQRARVGSPTSPVSEGLRSQSTTPHFLVRSTEPSYWRTGAYDVYTGSGWERGGDRSRRTLPVMPDTAPGDRRTIRQRVRLLQPARSLPAAWQPVDVGGGLGDSVRVTARGGLRAAGRLHANTTYTVVSRAPPRDVSRLRSAGRDYPADIESQYTELPDGTPARLRAFADRLTRDADTPYAKAVAVQRWLERNKRYSLNATSTGGSVADSFVFEMDRGYCEYFATAMAVMLRAEDVPARYVVGYSTGQPQGDDTYLVRAMNAHAWVEVYFPHTGWVRFDPTPGQRRLQSEAAAFERAVKNGTVGGGPNTSPGAGGTSEHSGTAGNGTGSDNESAGPTDGLGGATYDHAEEGSPGETFDQSGRVRYRISLSDDPVPGRDVTVRVERDGEPAAGVPVRFNGDFVGVTDAAGEVTGAVPFSKRLVVDVAGRARAAGSAGLLLGAGAAGAPGRRFATGGANQTNATRTFSVPTAVDVAVRGDPEPGGRVTIAATIRNHSVPDATVAIDGRTVGRTNDGGRLAVDLPVAERANVSVARGDARGNRTLRLANLSVTTSGFALPWLSLTATVTDGGEPVSGATVAVGATGATTGGDGRASVGLPLALAAQLRVETPTGLTVTRPVHYRYLTAGLVAVPALALLAVLVVLRRRAAGAGRSLGEQLVVALRWLSGAFVAVLVGAAVRAEDVVTALPLLARRLARAVRQAVAALSAAIRDHRLGLSALPGPRALLARLRALLARALAVPGSVISGDRPAADRPASDAAGGAGAADAVDARERIRRAWRAFRDGLPVTDYRTKTPGELARAGVEAGYPGGAVRTLREAVRAVEYGRHDPHAYLEDVAAAEAELEANEAETDAASAATDGGEGE
ncbi:MAG: transglutaminaseTgpA domain-containing protein [Haloarculaceae archaeon]